MKSLKRGLLNKENIKDIKDISDSFKTLKTVMKNHITKAIIEAWDDYGLDFTRDDIKKALERLAKEYDVYDEIEWSKNHIK